MHDLVNLDDRTFREILYEARSSIVRHAQEWTDHNDHDPGITLMEMLSWVTEVQQYYLNQVTVKSDRRFLALLGSSPRPAESAKTEVTFVSDGSPLFVHEGTRMSAGQVLFETAESLQLVGAQLVAVGVWDNDEFQAYLPERIREGSPVFAFGREPEVGNAILLGFDAPLPVGTPLWLSISRFSGYPLRCPDIPLTDATFVPSATIDWEYYGEATQGDGVGWQPLPVTVDETYQFSQSGKLRFTVDAMAALCVPEVNRQDCYWLRAVFRAGTFDLAPQIERVSFNTVDAAQTDTQAAVFVGVSGQTQLVLNHALVKQGIALIQAEVAAGLWRDIEADALEEYRLNESEAAITVSFTGPNPPNRLRVVACTPDFGLLRVVGTTTGVPFSRLRAIVPPVPGMVLSICEAGMWEDWRMVEDFDSSGPDDCHFAYDPEEGEFLFGDNEHGRCPAKSAVPNVRIVQYQVTLGAVGNIQPRQIDAVWLPDTVGGSVHVTNYPAAVGGRNAETMTEAKLRLRNDWENPTAAISDMDWERLVRSTPGVRIARVKVLPQFAPGLKGYPRQIAANHVSVVVVPFSGTQAPQPSAAFLETIRRHVEPYRLVTTVVHILPPVYVTVTVHATVVVEPEASKSERAMLAELAAFLAPAGAGFGGWEFGKMVYRGDLLNVIAKQPGVVFVQDLYLEAYGDGVAKDGDGDIRIPPSALVRSGGHQLALVSRLDL